MNSGYYPNIDEKSLRFILEMVKKDPAWLDGSHYNDDIKEFFGGKAEEEVLDVKPSSDQVIKDIIQLKKDLEKFGKDNREGKDANTYYRLMTSLIEKLVDYLERTFNIQKMEQFTEDVLNILEKELPVDKRNDIIESLRNKIQ